MNLDQIATKCFILALFIRDDGERLLLGDGYYDFNQKLQHFQANTIANDVVEIQGDNGQLLAGQVMRSGAQKFEGYIGDATTNRQTIEQKRSDFMAFFRIKHFYKVIYIFPDGTAIQRQRGYLTDAPTIPEIFQKFPEYSVALNFEDANYYEYAEDEHGDEIYAHIAELALAGGATGGLIWDAIGAVTNGITWSGIQTAQGEYIQITNELDIPAKLASVEMLGNAEQDDTPTPDYPQPISVVTGENTVKITGKNLFNVSSPAKSSTRSGITITIADDGLITIDGTATAALYPDFVWGINANTTTHQECYQYYGQALQLTASVKIVSGTTTSTQGIRFYFNDDGASQITAPMSAPYYATINSAYGLNRAWLYIPNGAVYNNFKFYLQLEEGNSASQFEPYQGQEFEVNLGKNLLGLQNTATTQQNGVTISVQDGTISLDGTASVSFGVIVANLTEDLRLTNGIDYAISMKTISGSANRNFDVQLRDNSDANIFSVNSDYFPVSRNTLSGVGKKLRLYFAYGTVFTNYKIAFQIERGSQATSFAPYFTPIELAKIGNYQDRIYKTDGKWYIEKQVGKVVLDGSENWTAQGGGAPYTIDMPDFNRNTNEVRAISDNFLGVKYNANWNDYSSLITSNSSSDPVSRFKFRYTAITSLADWKTWLSTHNTIVYYALATPTTTEITNEALIAQLDALGASSLYLGLNNIGTETLNAMPTLKIEYYTEYTLDGAGYEWEPGGNTAKTIVTVAGVDSAWPIWTVQGGAQNPTLTNITTGQTISWQGFVPEGQTLTINMAEMTADLAGANVFEYITGEWLRLAPGNNTLVYNAGSADKPSTLSWNGVLA